MAGRPSFCDDNEEQKGSHGSEGGKDVVTIILSSTILDCSVCSDQLFPPLFQCLNGHLTCSRCRTDNHRSNKCPTCLYLLSRCWGLEKVIESMNIPCSYAKYGCRETVSYTGRQSHEETCVYAPRSCPADRCKYQGPLELLYHHITREHGFSLKSFSYNRFFDVSLDGNRPFVLLREKDGTDLLLHLKDRNMSTRIVVSVACIRPGSLKEDY